MPGIDPTIIMHSLHMDPRALPVKQKKRKFAPKRIHAIREEVNKLLLANYVREVKYPNWLSEVVMVRKALGKWQMCVDFTDLNKACPKDSYPLSSID